MRLTATDFISYYRPSECGLRVYLRHKGEQESDPSEFDKVLRRLGERHERQALEGLDVGIDLHAVAEDDSFASTAQAIRNSAHVIYQGSFRAATDVDGSEVTVVGRPDLLLLDDDGYIIRDAKMSFRITEDDHPEIILQMGLYGWLYEQTTGGRPKGLQVYNGRQEIVPVPYDGGTSALARLREIVAIKELATEPYEPVGWSKCGGCGYNERCWKAATASSDVALVPDIDQSLARELRTLGVKTRAELLANYDVAKLGALKRPYGSRLAKVGNKATRILVSAELMEMNTERVLAVPAIPTVQNWMMFDLEGMPPHLRELDKIYLWGLQVFGERPSKYMAATAGFGLDGDKEGWLEFLRVASKVFDDYGDIPFIHYSTYEKTYVSKYIDRHGDLDGIGARVRQNLCDLLPILKDCVILPLPSYSLKVIEQYVGYERSQDEYGGEVAMAHFIEATETSDEAHRAELMDGILKYNEEDLAATWAVFEWLRGKKVASVVAEA